MSARRRPGRLPAWQEWSVYASFASLAVTGIAWFLLDRYVRVPGEFGPEHHQAQAIALIVHGAAAYAFLVIAGAMVPVHIVAGWNSRRNLSTGLSLAAALVVLAATALALYYLGDDQLRPSASLVHWIVGLIGIPLLGLHAWRGRRGG